MSPDPVPTEELLLGALLARQATTPPAGLRPADFTGVRRDVYHALCTGWEAGEPADVAVVASRVQTITLSTLATWVIAATDTAIGSLPPLVDALHQASLHRLLRPVGEALTALEGPALTSAVATLADAGALEPLATVIGAPPEWTAAVTHSLNGAGSQPVVALTLHELLAQEIPLRAPILEPILAEKDTMLVHAWRGVGKTHVGLGIGFAIATGTSFLRWHAPTPRRVLYLDGEMPGRTMQERLAALVLASGLDDLPADTFRLLCADLLPCPFPNLATPEGQAFVAPWVATAEVVIVDSIATLCSVGDQNTTESWIPLQAWALGLRRQGKTVIFLHHDAKGLEQRGTSAKEDILDTTIQLRHPKDYSPTEGARFEVHIKKGRGLHGAGALPFEARLEVVTGQAVWTVRTLEDALLHRAAALFRDGAKPQEVAAELGVSRATAYRLKQRAANEHLMEEP